MSLRCGIIGLPNIGKSTLFNALTGAAVAAHNYPFATIDPNVGVAEVRDERLEAIAAIVEPASVTPSTVEFVDVAGLVSGASQGEGLGNQFLARIREVDAIAHVVRCFDEHDVSHVEGSVDPKRDIEIVNLELILADVGTVERAAERTRRLARAGDKQARDELRLLDEVAVALGRGDPARSLDSNHVRSSASLQLLTAKPTMYVANVEDETQDPKGWASIVQQIAAAEGAGFVAIAGRFESELTELPAAERAEFIDEQEGSALDRLVGTAYDLLGLATFFTTANDKVEAWAIRRGSTAVEAAGLIHTDFARGFVRAEVISFEDFVRHGGPEGAKQLGARRIEGKDYVVADGDVVTFRANPT